MKISIFGLGYVGMVNAVCLAREGHEVVGIDVNPRKVEMVNNGTSPITEAHVEELLMEQVGRGLLRATSMSEEAVAQSQMSLICVGTPSTMQGTLDLTQVEYVCKQIGMTLRHTTSSHVVVLRSTMLPGSTKRMGHLLEEHSGRSLGQGLHIAFNPEFLREGTAVSDFYAPPYTILGTEHPTAEALLKEMYSFLSAPLFLVRVAEAELLKYASNAFHATKITFANEIGRLARTWGVDGARVMEVLCQDTVLNISSTYLRPGFAYGGSCLPKDLRAIVGQARMSNTDIPMLESLAWSNRMQIEHAYEIIARAAERKEDTIGFLGLAFKAGTDDLRESPMVELVERLLGKGYRLMIYDENVSLSRLLGKNKEFIEKEIPHIAELMAEDVGQIITTSKILVISNRREPYAHVLRHVDPKTPIISLEDVLSGRDGTQNHSRPCHGRKGTTVYAKPTRSGVR